MADDSHIQTLRVLQDVQDVHSWLFSEQREARCLEMIQPGELNLLLTAFFSEAKRPDGQEYEVEQLVRIHQSIETYLGNRHYEASLSDSAFEETHAALEAKGGGPRSQVRLKKLPPDVEEVLWTKNHFGSHDGEALNCTLLYYFTKFFNLTTKKEHKELCFGDVVLRSGEGNIRYLEFDPRLTRGNNSDDSANNAPTPEVNQYETFEPKLVFQGGPPEKDPVLLFEALIQHRPFRTRCPRSPMYLQPLLNHSNTTREWFEDKPLSTKSLNRIIRCISRGGKVSRKRSERRQNSQSPVATPPLESEPENEAERRPEIVSVEYEGQVLSENQRVNSDDIYQAEQFGYDDEVNEIMNSNAGPLVPAGTSGNVDLSNLSPGSRLQFTGRFGRDSADYGQNRAYSQSTTNDLPFSLVDVLRDDLRSLRSPAEPTRAVSPFLPTPHPVDSGLGELGPGYAPRPYGQDPASRLSGRSRLQSRLNVLRGGPPEARAARDTWRSNDIRANRLANSSYQQPRSVRWSSQEDLYNDPYDSGYSRPAIGYREGTGRYSPDVSRRDDYVHNTQSRLDEAFARRERTSRLRADRAGGRRYMTQPIDFNYSNYNPPERWGSNSDLSAVPSYQAPPSSTLSYARQARQRAEEREASAMQPRKTVSPPPGRPTTSNNEDGEVENMETEEQKEQRKAIRAKMMAGNDPLPLKSNAAKKKLILDETKLEEMFLKCLICGDIFNSSDRAPKLLPCHHTFCLACLLEMFRVEIEQRQAMVSVYHNRLPSAVRIGCPTCRDSRILSQDEIKKMPNDRTVLSLLDLVFHSESCVVNYCSRHQTQPLNFFCETCIQPVCCDCTVLDHMQSDNHEVMNIEGALNKYKPLIDECLTKLANHASELMESKTILESAIHTLDTNRTEVVNKLKETFQQFRTAADDREEELVEISQREICRRKDELTKYLELVLKQRESLQNTKDMLTKAQEEENVEQVFNNHKKLKEILADRVTVPEKMQDEFSANLDFDTMEQTNVIFKLSEFGEVIFEHT